MHYLINKTFIHTALTVCLLFLTTQPVVQAEEITAVTFTHQLSDGSHVYPGKDLKDRAYMFMGAFKAGLDEPLDENGTALFDQLYAPPQSDTYKYTTQKNLWGVNPGGPIGNLDRTHNLAYLNLAIHRADNLICLLNDPKTGRIVMSTGKREALWAPGAQSCPIEGPMPIVAHLSTGVCGSSLMRVVNYILSHPQLHELPAPAPLHPELLPTHIQDLGSTYLDRARIYLNASNTICEFFIREGSYWEFDTTNPDNIHGWWFNNAMATYKDQKITGPANDIKYLAETKANHPNGIQFSAKAFSDLKVGGRPVNRALLLNSMFAATAHALDLVDRLDGTHANQKTIETYNTIIRHCNNTFRSFSIDVDEGPLLGVSRIFQYAPARIVDFMDNKLAWYVEDAGHLLMDMGAISTLQEVADLHPENPSFQYMTDQDLQALIGTLASRFFDLQANIVCSTIYADSEDKRGERGRQLGLDEEGIPHGHPGYQENKGCPSASGLIGRYGSVLQQLAINAKHMEMGDERLRVIETDPNTANFVLQRTDTWPNYRFAYPFELKALRAARARYRPEPVKPNKYAPTCSAPARITIRPSMKRGQKLLTLKGDDKDSDQIVTYWIIGGNHGLHLYLDPMSGELSLNKYYPLAEGEPDAYTLKVMVSDNGNPTRYQTLTIPVTITSN